MALAGRLSGWWCCAVLCACAFPLAGAWAAAPQFQAGAQCTIAQPVTQARRIVARDERVLDDTLVALPDRVPLAWRDEQVRIRYEVDVSACAEVESAALALYRVGAPFRASVDGVPLQSLLSPSHLAEVAGRGTVRPALLAPVFNGRIPILLALPAAAQQVQIDLLTLPYIPSGLTILSVGPTNTMMPITVGDVHDVIGYADAVAGVMLVLALMALVLWLHRRHDMGFLWMTLACASWSVRALAYFDHDIHVPPLLYEQLNPFNILLTAIGLCAATLATMVPRELAGHAQADRDWRRWPRRMLLFAAASSVAAIALAQWLGHGAMLARAYTQLWALGLSSATIWWLWSQRVRLNRWHRIAALVAYCGLVASAAHDMGLVIGAIPVTGPSLLFWGFTVVLVVYALISGDYIITTLNRAENSNFELERRITGKSDELEHSYRQLRKTEMASALASARLQERERLLRDMHDGLGAHLMTALRGVERSALDRGQIAQSLQDGMDELRMMMDSADMGSDLSVALAAWRNRWDGRLGAAGVQLHWHLDDSIDETQLHSDALLQIMRILQETATNVVKHAGASNLYVDARLRQDGERTMLVIAARDDGRGLPAQDGTLGQRGLRNMRHRAAQIGAQLDIQSAGIGAGGCQVVLALQIHPAQERPERRSQARTMAGDSGAPALVS